MAKVVLWNIVKDITDGLLATLIAWQGGANWKVSAGIGAITALRAIKSYLESIQTVGE